MLSATILLSILKVKRHNSNTSKQNALVAEQKCTNRKKNKFSNENRTTFHLAHFICEYSHSACHFTEPIFINIFIVQNVLIY